MRKAKDGGDSKKLCRLLAREAGSWERGNTGKGAGLGAVGGFGLGWLN